jgi:hypothetical protein
VKTLIAYYSRSGLNERIANEFQEKIGCDIEKVVDTVNRKGAWGYFISGMQTTFRRKTKIKPIEKDPGNYDVVVIVCPLWVGIIPPPIRTYISENKLDRIALLSVSGDGPGNKKGVSDFESLAGKKVLANLLLTENQFKQRNYKEELQSFATLISTE